MDSSTNDNALPAGTRLGELEILRVLGVGGFGIVYLARDHALERDVALKEYMPASLALRGGEGQITVRSASFAETYALGLRSFVNEARLLARFDHPSLVKVYRFWEEKGTAYMVMPVLHGLSLRDVRRAMTEPPDEAWLRGVLDPVLAAVELLHREGVFHRDIAPDNIIVAPGLAPVLLDFGAARRAIGDRTQAFTAILKPSYAPIEQYAEMNNLRQGPWTDLYAIGAVTHFLIFGKPPSPATARAVMDDLGELSGRDDVPGISPRFMAVLAWCLAVRPAERPQDVATLRAALDGRVEPPMPVLRVVPGDAPTMLIPKLGGFEPTTLEPRRAVPAPVSAPAPSLTTAWAPVSAPASASAPAPAAAAAAAAASASASVPASASAASSTSTPSLPPPPGRRAPSAPLPSYSVAGSSPHASSETRRRVPWASVGLAAALGAVAIGWYTTRPAAEAPEPARASASAPMLAAPVASAPVAVAAPVVPAAVASAPAVALKREEVTPAAVPAAVPLATAARPAPRADGALRPRRVEEAMLRRQPDRPVAEAATAPALAPAATEPLRERSVRDVCGRRVLIALERCLERECRLTQHRSDPDCLWFAEQRRQRANPDP